MWVKLQPYLWLSLNGAGVLLIIRVQRMKRIRIIEGLTLIKV